MRMVQADFYEVDGPLGVEYINAKDVKPLSTVYLNVQADISTKPRQMERELAQFVKNTTYYTIRLLNGHDGWYGFYNEEEKLVNVEWFGTHKSLPPYVSFMQGNKFYYYGGLRYGERNRNLIGPFDTSREANEDCDKFVEWLNQEESIT